MKRYLRIGLVTVPLLGLLFSYTHCGKGGENTPVDTASTTTNSIVDTHEYPDILTNTWKEADPRWGLSFYRNKPSEDQPSYLSDYLDFDDIKTVDFEYIQMFDTENGFTRCMGLATIQKETNSSGKITIDRTGSHLYCKLKVSVTYHYTISKDNILKLCKDEYSCIYFNKHHENPGLIKAIENKKIKSRPPRGPYWGRKG